MLSIPLPIEAEITYPIYEDIYYIRGYSMPPSWATFVNGHLYTFISFRTTFGDISNP
jgi:hypothetical protein